MISTCSSDIEEERDMYIPETTFCRDFSFWIVWIFMCRYDDEFFDCDEEVAKFWAMSYGIFERIMSLMFESDIVVFVYDTDFTSSFGKLEELHDICILYSFKS